MKKNLWFAALALVAMTSCSNDDVMDVADNKSIEFKSFVNKNVRAVNEVTTDNLNEFYVFGNFKPTTGGEYSGQVFNNELQSTPYYWVAGNTYSFGAYANGNGTQIENEKVSYTASDEGGTLTFTDYEANDAKDLVAAVATVNCTDATNQEAVKLSFKHLLSQVKFTFNTTDAESYTLKITNLKVHASTKGNCSYDGTASWNSTYGQTTTYDYPEIADVSTDGTKTKSTEYKLVIPQGTTQKGMKVTFTATISGSGLIEKTANFEGTLAVDPDIAGMGSTANLWKPGYRYNYTAEINGDKIDPSLENQKITFDVESVEGWYNTNPETQPANPSDTQKQ